MIIIEYAYFVQLINKENSLFTLHKQCIIWFNNNINYTDKISILDIGEEILEKPNQS